MVRRRRKVQHRFFHMEPKLRTEESCRGSRGVDFAPRPSALVRREWMVALVKVEIVDGEIRNRIEQERSAQLQS